MAEEMRSTCHNSTVSPLKGGKEGEVQCDVCAHKCEVEGQGSAPAGNVAQDDISPELKKVFDGALEAWKSVSEEDRAKLNEVAPALVESLGALSSVVDAEASA